MTRKFFIITLLTLIISPLTLANDQSTLKKLTNKIASIRSLLNQDNDKRDRLQKALEKNEIISGKLSKQLHKTRRNLTQQATLLQALKKSEKNYQGTLEAQQALLTKQIKTAYVLGRQPYLKLILNQQDSNQLSRILMYYQYINRDRISAIDDLQNTLMQIEKNQQQIRTQYDTLHTLQQKQQTEKSKLIEIKKNRQQLIQVINDHIQNRTQRLQRLIANKRQLEQTLKRLAGRVQRQRFGNFARWRGKLLWPTKGKVLPIYGTKIEQSELKWGGVLIKAPDGRPVHAVANGKVVFAKWLPGYGLLIIINHGNGYMTLYGRNHALYKATGDIVRIGDLIATVGQSGGYQTPALYFAIRHNGKPLNPESWVRRR